MKVLFVNCLKCLLEVSQIRKLSRYRRLHSILLVCLLPTCPALVSAEDVIDIDVDPDTPKIEWMPGEHYDIYTGTMGYKAIDLSLPGNGGLPIEITRVFVQPQEAVKTRWGNSSLSFGRMALMQPSLTIKFGAGEYKGCNPRYLIFSNGSNNNEEFLRGVREVGPFTFSDGEQRVYFYPTDAKNASLAKYYHTDSMPHYISEDNWYMNCTQGGQLVIKRPDGLHYLMIREDDLYDREGVGYRDYSAGTKRYFVDKIYDPFGNWLRHSYRFFRSEHPAIDQIKLSQITSSDGRSVSINYVSVGGFSRYVYRIASITGNGSPNPLSVEYEYHKDDHYTSGFSVTKNGIATTTYRFRDYLLDSITYPTGGKVVYQYHGSKHRMGYRELASRETFPDGGVTKFSHESVEDKIFARLIGTETALFEYHFKKPYVRQPKADWNAPSPFPPDRKKLLKYKVYGQPVMSYWAPGATHSLLMERTFSYKSLYRVHDRLQLNSAARIVLYKEDTRMGGFTSPGRRSLFTKEITKFNFRGYPAEIVETSGVENESRTTYITYDHEYINTAQTGKPTRVSVDGKDIVETTYQHNKIASIRKNGKIQLSQEWYPRDHENAGELRSVTNGQGGQTVYSDYFRGIARVVKNPNGHYQTTKVNSDGTIKSRTRFGDSQATTYTYDPLRRLVTEDPPRPGELTRVFQWSDSGRTRAELTGNGTQSIRTWNHDAFGRLIRTTETDAAQGKTIVRRYSYDKQGRLQAETHPVAVNETSLGIFATGMDHVLNAGDINDITYSYDALGRTIQVRNRTTDGQWNSTRYVYGQTNEGDLAVNIYDGRKKMTKQAFKSYGEPHYRWPVSITSPDNVTTRVKRNKVGNVLETSRAGVVTKYTYGSDNLLKSMERPEDGVTTFDYYDDGMLRTRYNGRRSVRYSYHRDLKTRQVDQLELNGGGAFVKQQFLYDRNGNLGSVVSQSGDGDRHGHESNRINYQYDESNNLISETLVIDDVAMEVKYQYDGYSNRSFITYPNGNAYHLRPSIFGGPTHIRQVVGNAKVIYDTIQYNADQSVHRLKRAGHEIVMSLDDAMRAETLSLKRLAGGGAKTLKSLNYAYDGVNNVTRIRDEVNGRDSWFGYDDKNRLTMANFNYADSWAFGYLPTDDIAWMERAGKRSVYRYDGNSRRLASVEQNGRQRIFEYDYYGNTTTFPKVNEAGEISRMQLDYNPANQLARMSDGTRYSYDARGLRVKKDSGGAIYSFYDNNKKLIYRDDRGAGVTSEYFYAGGKLIARRDVDLSGNVTPGPDTDGNQNPVPVPVGRPGTPTPMNPWGAIAEASPEYRWKATAGAQHYHLEIRKADSDQLVFSERFTASALGCASGTGECRLRPRMSFSGANRWKLKAENANGASEWTGWTKFTVSASTSPTASTIPTALQPKGNGAGSNPTYTWSAVSTATHYTVEVRKSDGSIPLFYTALSAADARCPSGSGNCSFSKPDIAMSGANRWRVRTRQGDNYGQWSEWAEFTASATGTTPSPSPSPSTLQPPATQWPANSGAGPTPRYQWSAMRGVPVYNLEVRKQGTTNPLFFHALSAAEANCASETGSCTFSKPDIRLSGANQWRVRSQNGVSHSRWSSWRDFNVAN